MSTTQTAPAETNRYNGKCKCGEKFSALVESIKLETGPVLPNCDHRVEFRGVEGSAGQSFAEYCYGLVWRCTSCNRWRLAKKVLGKFRPDRKCDARCTSATGHNCECACGGKNHGASNA